MKPGGVILTRMIWNKPKYWPFNIGLLAWQLAFLIVGKLYGKVEVQWRDIWRAATICHVRLVINEKGIGGTVRVISFTAPEVEIEPWLNSWNIKSCFSYLAPTFDISDAEIEAMNEYAEKIKGDPVARKYDYLQLLGYCVNLPLWIVWPRCWGRQVIGWFNLPGGREVCSSGVTAILRWRDLGMYEVNMKRWGWLSMYFRDYSTSMVSPCLFDIDKNWRRK